MSEPLTMEPTRLQELEEVTREYGRFGRTAFGLGETAIGAWIVAAGVGYLIAPEWGRLLVALGAPFWFGIVAMTRRNYQRRGSVTPVEVVPAGIIVPADVPARVRGVMDLVFFGVVFGVLIALPQSSVASYGGGLIPGVVGLAVLVTSTVATLLLAWIVGRGYRDTYPAGTLIYLAWWSGGGLPFTFIAYGLCLVGVVGVVQGVREHRRYARLERRLGALKASA